MAFQFVQFAMVSNKSFGGAWRSAVISLLLLGFFFFARFSEGQTSKIKQDQEVLFFPALAYPVETNKWELQIHGCVFEPEKRVVSLAFIRELLALDRIHLSKAENQLFKERARLFMVDEKGGRKIAVRIRVKKYRIGRSQPNGHFMGKLEFTAAEIQALRASGQARFQLALPENDKRLFEGEIHFVDDAGIIVISDIDDTIKVTGVHDTRATLRNTFIRQFEAVPGMAALYRGWAETNHAEFFYVSASPWQLFAPLSEFIRSNSFPAGPFFLKNVDIKDKTFFALFQGPELYKPGVIEPLIKQFPHRKFVLVGDLGESDPEIYGDLARKYPEQVSRIFIRDLPDGTDHSERYRKAFEKVPAQVWKTFREPTELSIVPLAETGLEKQ